MRLVTNRSPSRLIAVSLTAVPLAPAFIAVIALTIVGCEVYTPELLEPVTTETPGPEPETEPTGNSPISPSGSSPEEPDEVAPSPNPDDSTPPAPAVTGTPSDPEPGPTPSSGGTVVPDPTAPGDPEPAPTQPSATTPGPDATVPAGPNPAPAPTGPTEPEPETSSDNPLIADFEGNSDQLSGGHREGYWFTDGSSEGSITELDDVFVETPAGNGAVHVLAKDYAAMSWATFGVDFNDGAVPPAYTQAAQYQGIRFWACTGAPSGVSELFFEVVTLDTSMVHADSNQDNHYRARLDLDDQWTAYEFDWTDLEQTWGNKTPVFDIDGVVGLRFSLEAEGFDLWLDDVEFIEADLPSTVTDPPSGACPVSAPSPAVDAGTP